MEMNFFPKKAYSGTPEWTPGRVVTWLYNQLEEAQGHFQSETEYNEGILKGLDLAKKIVKSMTLVVETESEENNE